MKLRNMSAYVTEEKNITIVLASGEVLNLENALVLHSYSSRVAVYCKMRVYLLPRYDYSVTTWKHVHAFIQDYCRFVWDTNYADYEYGVYTCGYVLIPLRNKDVDTIVKVVDGCELDKRDYKCPGIDDCGRFDWFYYCTVVHSECDPNMFRC